MTIAEISTNKDFSDQELADLDPMNVPHHLAIIMDGNRRWAKKNNLPPIMGHWQGAEALTQIVRDASEIGIKVLTVYSFSTENWGRSKQEIHDLIHLLEVYLKEKKEMMIEEGVKLSTIGDLTKMPVSLQEIIKEVKLSTQKCEKIELVLAINYGARNEICRAVQKICSDIKDNKLSINDLSENIFSNYLDTKDYRDPDLLIRTSGEQRLSNFLLWQISYTEVYITKVLWPDFDKTALLTAINEFQKRQRRLGKK
ncbi:MAG: isoprenyl transferase [Chlamydiota bacterium]|jgi:undecaprenyl diphosphate synthase